MGMGFYDHGDPPAQCKRTIAQRSATTSAEAFDLTPAKRRRGRHDIHNGQTIRSGGQQAGADIASAP
jgi:hypothetical protein